MHNFDTLSEEDRLVEQIKTVPLATLTRAIGRALTDEEVLELRADLSAVDLSAQELFLAGDNPHD